LFGAGISGSGSGAEMILFYHTETNISRKRAVSLFKSAHSIARKEMQEPWFLLALLPTFAAIGKSRSLRRAKLSPSTQKQAPQNNNIP
jgi:hypothetical protein